MNDREWPAPGPVSMSALEVADGAQRRRGRGRFKWMLLRGPPAQFSLRTER